MDRGAWWATVYGVTKSEMLLRDPHFHFFSMIYGAESYDYLPFVYLLWWSFYSDILPIFKLDYLFSCLTFESSLHILDTSNLSDMCLASISSQSVQFSSVAQSCPILCDPMNLSTPGLPVHHQLPEFTQTHVHQVSDVIQPSHPPSSPSPALNLSQYQGLFK